MADFLNNVAAQDVYSPACSIGPYYEARTAVITVANNAALLQFAVGSYGNWRWMDEREYFSITQSFRVGRVIGVRFRNATAGQVARILATLSGDDDPDFESGTPFTGTLTASGQISPTVSLTTGDIFYSAGSAVRTGAVIADGTHYNSVANPQYAPLFALIGTTYGGTGSNDFAVPDLLDRVAIGAGRNTALGGNDGISGANRHATRHKHSPHAHTLAETNVTAGGANKVWSFVNQAASTNTIPTADGGSGVTTDPLDGAAYLALTPYIIL